LGCPFRPPTHSSSTSKSNSSENAKVAIRKQFGENEESDVRLLGHFWDSSQFGRHVQEPSDSVQSLSWHKPSCQQQESSVVRFAVWELRSTLSCFQKRELPD
jgi:hypothetical protein